MIRRPTPAVALPSEPPPSGVRRDRREVARPSRFAIGAAASLLAHAVALAAVAGAAAWRAAPEPAEAALQVFWQEADPISRPDSAALAEPPSRLPELALIPAPTGSSWADGMEPEDADLTAPVPPPPAVADAIAPAGAAPPPARIDPSVALAALAFPALPPLPSEAVPPPALPAIAPPAPPRAALPPQAPQPRRTPEHAAVSRRPAPAASPAPAPVVPVALAAPIAAVKPPLLAGLPRYRQPPSPPIYPAQARDRGEEGTVALRVLVAADGGIREIRLHRSSGNRLFDEAALAAARRWEIEPATVDGQRIDAWVEAPVRFRLEQ